MHWFPQVIVLTSHVSLSYVKKSLQIKGYASQRLFLKIFSFLFCCGTFFSIRFRSNPFFIIIFLNKRDKRKFSLTYSSADSFGSNKQTDEGFEPRIIPVSFDQKLKIFILESFGCTAENGQQYFF